MSKSAHAFRTIREVADWLGVAAHVLRFWESKFHQIKPVKRAGGRRYYRPADMALVGGIKVLLHDRGLTIRGVQKMISDEGVDAIAALSPPIDDIVEDEDEILDMAPDEAWDADTEAEGEDAEPTIAGYAAGSEDLPGRLGDPVAPRAEAAEAEPDAEMDQPELLPEDDADADSSQRDLDAAGDRPVDSEPPEAEQETTEEDDTAPDAAAAAAEADEAGAEALPEDVPDPTTAPKASALPASDPAEGALGALAALARLPSTARKARTPQIAALARLHARMSAPPPSR